MSRRAIATGSPGLVSSSQAQDTRLAAVDASGRIFPPHCLLPSFKTIGTGGATPCPAKAMTLEDARALSAGSLPRNVSPDFTLAVAKNESHFDAIALSDKGAFGLLQLMPDTARLQCRSVRPGRQRPWRVRLSPGVTTRYRNPLYIVQAYNAGEDAVDKNRRAALPGNRALRRASQ